MTTAGCWTTTGACARLATLPLGRPRLLGAPVPLRLRGQGAVLSESDAPSCIYYQTSQGSSYIHSGEGEEEARAPHYTAASAGWLAGWLPFYSSAHTHITYAHHTHITRGAGWLGNIMTSSYNLDFLPEMMVESRLLVPADRM